MSKNKLEDKEYLSTLGVFYIDDVDLLYTVFYYDGPVSGVVGIGTERFYYSAIDNHSYGIYRISDELLSELDRHELMHEKFVVEPNRAPITSIDKMLLRDIYYCMCKYYDSVIPDSSDYIEAKGLLLYKHFINL